MTISLSKVLAVCLRPNERLPRATSVTAVYGIDRHC